MLAAPAHSPHRKDTSPFTLTGALRLHRKSPALWVRVVAVRLRELTAEELLLLVGALTRET